MPTFLKKFVSYAFYLLFVLAFLFVVNKLFIGFEFGLGDDDRDSQSASVLRIIYPDEPAAFDPNAIDSVTRQRTVNVFEPLVRQDKDLQIEPALALSWGLIDEVTWEFKLRPNVKFHDGSDFDFDDVKASFDRVFGDKNAELASILGNILSIDQIDYLTFRISTDGPDPLLLQRLSLLMITPAEYQNGDVGGTGPYKISEWEKSAKITYQANANYWQKTPRYEEVIGYTKTDKFDRIKLFLDGGADFLTFTPYDAVDIVEERGLQTVAIPSLEVQFLIFNFRSDYMSKLDNRRAVSMLVDQDYLVDAVGGFARQVNQYVSNGIFGFNSDIDDHVYDPEEAARLGAAMSGKTLKMDLLQGLDLLGEHVRTQMKEMGVSLVVSYLDGNALVESMRNGDADIYFLGLKSDLGDASSFLDDLVYSLGTFNISSYSNEEVDELIESAMVEMDEEGRLEMLQDVMQIVVEDDFVGVPLFEYETVYSLANGFSIEPRIDGLIYFDDIKN